MSELQEKKVKTDTLIIQAPIINKKPYLMRGWKYLKIVNYNF